MCGDVTILSSLPEAWPPDELSIAIPWFSGTLAGLLLRALLWVLGIEEALAALLDEVLGEGLGAGTLGGILGAALARGLGGGLLGTALVEECCANTADERDKITATIRLENCMAHLLPTERSDHRNRSVFL
jgi:hypothetical protein